MIYSNTVTTFFFLNVASPLDTFLSLSDNLNTKYSNKGKKINDLH